MHTTLTKTVFSLVFAALLAPSAIGQQAVQDQLPAGLEPAQNFGKPEMENVFFNTLWGSLVGGTVALSFDLLAASDSSDEGDEESRFSYSKSSKNFVEGATYGGLAGAFIGFLLSLNDVEFREKDPVSRLTHTNIPGVPQRFALPNLDRQWATALPPNPSSPTPYAALSGAHPRSNAAPIDTLVHFELSF